MAQKRTPKEKAREEHPRPARHAHGPHAHSHEGCGCADELDESQPASALPMERLLRVLRHALEDRDFHNQRELEEFLVEFSEDNYNQVLARLTAGSPREQA